MPLFAQEAKDEINFAAEDAAREKEQLMSYKFSVSYRLEAGYVQDWQHSKDNSYPNTYFNGGRLGVTFDFNLPLDFTIQTGILYSLTYGSNDQHWRNVSTEDTYRQWLHHDILRHHLVVPVRATYTQKLWRKLGMYFYGGPQMQIGIAYSDYITDHLNDATRAWVQSVGVNTVSYDRYSEKQLNRFNIQLGLGIGLQWDNYRLQGGYDFGVNDLVKGSFHSWDWGWNVCFSYGIKTKSKK